MSDLLDERRIEFEIGPSCDGAQMAAIDKDRCRDLRNEKPPERYRAEGSRIYARLRA